jgi:hypothetical protein
MYFMNQITFIVFHRNNKLVYINAGEIVKFETETSAITSTNGSVLTLRDGMKTYIDDPIEDVLTIIKSQCRVIE